jgi:hypothetical protein
MLYEITKGKERERTESLFKQIMAKNIPDMGIHNLHEGQGPSDRLNSKTTSPTHIIIKNLKTEV